MKRTLQEISDATRVAIDTNEYGFLAKAQSEIQSANEGRPVGGKTTIARSRISEVVSGNYNFRLENATLAERWLLEYHPWAFALPLDSLHVNRIQQFFGAVQPNIVAIKKPLMGTFTAIRDHGPHDKEKLLISKFEFVPNTSTGTIEVREEFTTKLEGRDGVVRYSWEGICFPMGRFLYVMMRERKTDKQLRHIKFMILFPNKGHKDSIYQLCGHYLLGLNGIEHVRHTNIFMVRDQLRKECYINPVQPELLDEDLTRRMNDSIKRIASFEI